MPDVHLERDGAVATLVLDDARRKNAMSPELGDALAARVREISADASVRAVVLAGAGDAFSAGGDLAMLERLRAASFAEARAFMLGFYHRYLSITELDVPVLVVVRKQPRMQLVKDALIERTAGGLEKWALIEQHGPLERCGALWVQRVGLTIEEASDLLAATTSHGNIPEPLRLAHIIAGGVERGASRGRP